MKRTIKIVLLMPLCLLLVLIVLHLWDTNQTPSGPGRWRSESPDGRFIVTGHSNKGLRSWIPTMPGDGGYGPGIIILRDKKTGKILQQAKVDNLGGMGRRSVQWMMGGPDAVWRKGWPTATGAPREGDYVHITLVAIWPLPSLDGKLPPPLK
ncbi:MAG: hypothetical protein LBR95_01850 [Azoarcus sp.]|jgi:hypothetical protein|nr:hypothetical protein [Azoarcus sp.]